MRVEEGADLSGGEWQKVALARGRASLLISHRFSTVKMADHIVVIEHGRVTEQGSHEKLVTLGGRYAELFEMQAERYR